MNAFLHIDQVIRGNSSGKTGIIKAVVGDGGQGVVYRVCMDGHDMALKWLHPNIATLELKHSIENLIDIGPPSDSFIWPIELVTAQGKSGFGYLMRFIPNTYKKMKSILSAKTDPSFRSACTAGYELANNMLLLHCKGLAYRDISYDNVFFEPAKGRILICDNDNVTYDGNSYFNVFGTPRFMAPEIVCGKATPSTATDLHSLAILLFYFFFRDHPLEGAKTDAIHCMDEKAMKRIYGNDPIYIFDPNNSSNRPIQGIHNNAIIYYKIYPLFLMKLFEQAFTKGLTELGSHRVRESIWRGAMIKLRDLIVCCRNCGKENFFDAHKKRQFCWSCQEPVELPTRMKIDDDVVVLDNNTELFLHHISRNRYDFSKVVAKVNAHPKYPYLLGLTNLSRDKWTITNTNSTTHEVLHGQNVRIKSGIKINFGEREGIVRERIK